MDRARFITIIKWWREPWGLKKSVEAVAVAVVLVAALSTYLGLEPVRILAHQICPSWFRIVLGNIEVYRFLS